MRTISAIRKIDSAGRIVLPKDLREKLLLIEDKDSVELYTDGDEIILRKRVAGCMFCKAEQDLVAFHD